MAVPNKYTNDLVEGEDYLVILDSVFVELRGQKKHISTVKQVYLTTEDGDVKTVYKCDKCDYVRPKALSVLAHQNGHTSAERLTSLKAVREKAKAFDLLPEKIKAALLEKVRAA